MSKLHVPRGRATNGRDPVVITPEMAFCDDPAHHWIRDSWANQPPDPRCPLTR